MAEFLELSNGSIGTMAGGTSSSDDDGESDDDDDEYDRGGMAMTSSSMMASRVVCESPSSSAPASNLPWVTNGGRGWRPCHGTGPLDLGWGVQWRRGLLVKNLLAILTPKN